MDSRTRGLADVLARVPPDFNLKGAPHVARNLWLFSRRVDGLIDGIDTATLGLDAASTELREDLEDWAQIIEGAIEPGRSRRERIFRLPGWLVAERARLTSLKPGTSITEPQSFAVDDIGVSWVGHRRQEQNFGGKYVLPLTHRDPSRDGHPRIRSWYNTSGDPDTWQSIEARAYAHYRDFVQAVRDTRVFAAMKAIGRERPAHGPLALASAFPRPIQASSIRREAPRARRPVATAATRIERLAPR